MQLERKARAKPGELLVVVSWHSPHLAVSCVETPVSRGYGGEMRGKRRFFRWLAIRPNFDHNMILIAPVPTRAGVLFVAARRLAGRPIRAGKGKPIGFSLAPSLIPPSRNSRHAATAARETGLRPSHRERSVGAFSTLFGKRHVCHSFDRARAERLQEELQRLKTVERPAVINAIAEARAQGDLSENAEYDAARERQGFIEAALPSLKALCPTPT